MWPKIFSVFIFMLFLYTYMFFYTPKIVLKENKIGMLYCNIIQTYNEQRILLYTLIRYIAVVYQYYTLLWLIFLYIIYSHMVYKIYLRRNKFPLFGVILLILFLC